MLRVALIDESPEHAAALTTLLEQQPQVAVVAAGSLESDIVDLLASEPPDVVLLDAPAEPQTVREAVSAIHTLLPHTRLVVTALDDNHDHVREIWAASGADFVPQKRLFREPAAALDPLPW
jgi:DNA-binding NarL/FixJ family response regulator